MNKIREVFFYKNYFLDFFDTLTSDVKTKLNWTLRLIETTERVPIKYFKYLESSTGIYEIRVEFGSNIYRVFSFFDEGKLIILINGFKKKSNKTPRSEIAMAEKIKKEYFNEKSNNQ
ncbi:MAG: type II toxin-antitoxin system RelE/ParE family toxin [Prolixibacteraceae bacterium]|nr:type II toxin-antitoxin system RelE/ParE family toxin [Prolixibacteraceae bacterium]